MAKTKSKSSLPKSWTTVTPLSKFLAMALFITMPFIGFYLGIQYQKMSTPAFPPASYFTDPHVMRPMMNKPNQPHTLCTQDAKKCSDGTWVGRTGPNCQFVCPGESAASPMQQK